MTADTAVETPVTAERSRKKVRKMAADHGWTVVQDYAYVGFLWVSQLREEPYPVARMALQHRLPDDPDSLAAKLTVEWKKGRFAGASLHLVNVTGQAVSARLYLLNRMGRVIEVLTDPNCGFRPVGGEADA